MVHLCVCSQGSSHTLESHQGSKACKYCGGHFSVDGLGALAGNMLSSEGLDVIDPQLNWKTATKGRQRAVRKARTSFPAVSKKRVSAKNSKEITDAAEKQSLRMDDIPALRMDDIPVSESEKVGVSILGRRFSDSLENIPIKKRKFLLVRSPSPPLQSPDANDSDLLLEHKKVVYEEALMSKTSNTRGTTEEVFDAADFSGISILAAAACNSDIGTDLINAGALVSQGQSHNVAPLVNFFRGIESNSTGEELMGRCNNSTKSCPTSEAQMKQTDEGKLSGSDSKNPSDCSQNDSEKIRFSRDSRLHWDLNTVMDAWDSARDDVNSEPSVSCLAVENGDDNNKLEASPSTQAQPDFIECLQEHDTTEEHCADISKTNISRLNNDELKSAGICNGNIIANCKKELHLGNENEPNTEGTPTLLKGSCVESKLENNEENKSHIPFADEVRTPNGPPVNEIDVKIDCDSGLMMEAELVPSHVPLVEDISCANERNADFICTGPTSEQVSDDGRKDMIEEIVSNCGDAAAAKLTDLSNFQLEKQENITVEMHERACTMLSDITICRNALPTSIINHVISDELGACNGDSGCKAYGDLHSSLSNIQQCNNEKSLEMILGGACADYQNDAEQKANESQCANLINDKLTCSRNDDNCGQRSSEDSLPVSTSSASLKPDTNSLGHVCIEEAGRKDTEACVDSSKDVAPDVRLNSDPVQIASQIRDDQADGMEKLDLIGDDDSQYEDGEFRESILYSWGEEGVEETEQLDYGSDNRENDTFETVTGSTSFPVDSMASRNGDLALPGSDGSHAPKDRQAAGLITLSKCSSTSQDCDAVSWKRNPGSVKIEGHKDNFAVNEIREGVDASLCGIGDKLTGYMVFQRSDYNKEPSTSLKMKMSGWDKLPEGQRGFREDDWSDIGFDSVKQDHNTFDISGSESFRAKLAWRRDSSSRVDRPRPLEESCRSDRSYIRSIRRDDHRGPSPKAQREAITSGRGGPSHYGQGRGRTDCWFDSSNHGHVRHHDSPGYYGAPTFSQPDTRNAAAAAVAKVESNGFVVAPDGTLVKAAGAGADTHLPRRSSNTSTQNPRGYLSGRGSPTERDRQCGLPRALGHSREFSPRRHFSVGRGQADRYGNEIVREQYRRNVLNGPMDMSPATHQLPRRDRSISPHRVPLNLSRSRTRSQSRSRTRSPQRWTSPRGRFDATVNSARRRSRSPNFKTESRMVRMRSPRQRPSFQDRIGGYGPTSRIHASPPHASRWIDERDDSSDRLREHEYKRSSRRSPNIRGIRNHRFDSEDSQGRLKHDDYVRNIRPSRVPEYAGFDRRFKHDGDGRGRREERYELLHSAKHYDSNNNMKRLHYDVDNSFHTSPGVKPSGFHRRGNSPSGFDRGMPRQLRDSPGRDHVAKVHY